MRIIIINIILCLTCINLNAQSIEITLMDEVDWNKPPDIIRNSTFYLLGTSGNVIKTGKYSKGKKDGLFLYFHEGKGLYKEENYVDGKLHGFWKEYKIDGYEVGYYKKGKKDGEWKIYNKNKTEIFEYKNNILNGSYKFKDSDNNEIVGKYRNGNKNGIWHYYLNNSLIYKKVYSDGKLISSVESED